MFEKQYTTLNERFWLRVHRNVEAFSGSNIDKIFIKFNLTTKETKRYKRLIKLIFVFLLCLLW